MNDKIIQMYLNGMNGIDIANKLGISSSKVYYQLKKSKIKRRSACKPPEPIHEKYSEIEKKYISGVSAPKLAAEYAVSVHLISKWLKENGIELRGKLEPSFDYDYFENIDSEEKAYWLGFFAADGYISPSAGIRLELNETDSDHLNAFSTALQIPSGVKERKRDNCVYVQAKSVKMRDDLHKLGIYSGTKSKKLKLPCLKGDLNRHMWRGYFDGDGCVYLGMQHNYVRSELHIVGTEDVCNQFELFVKNIIGVDCDSKPYSYESYWRFGVSGDYAKEVIHYLYQDATIYLQRKYEKNMMVLSEEFSGIHKIKESEAKEFMQKYHYLDSFPSATISYGYFKKGLLIAVATIGSPTSFAAQTSIFGEEKKSHVRELRRFAIAEEHNQKNLASQFLASLMKQLYVEGIWAVITYSDSYAGHTGSIYKAIGAMHLGSTGKEVVHLYNGKQISVRSVDDSIDYSKVKMKVSEGKEKFLMFTGNKRERRNSARLCKVKED